MGSSSTDVLVVQLQVTMRCAARCAVTQGPPEGTVDHSLEKADTRKGECSLATVAGLSPERVDVSFCSFHYFLKSILPPMNMIIFL